MPKICYVPKNFRDCSLELIDQINGVIDDYASMGYTLTLRQCYYQLVARGIIDNNQKVYKTTGNLINDARLAGLIDWNAIEDRTRNLRGLSHWSEPKSVIESAAYSYRRDVWLRQGYHVEVWVEKEANECDVPYFCCRGYVSQSEMWAAANRFKQYQQYGKYCVLIHLGDHDPSGIDMSRDIQERLALFGVDKDLFDFRRIALNLDQIQTFNPPPNPAKITDSRSTSYINKFGDESWELDALEPGVLHDLIKSTVEEYEDTVESQRVRELVEKEKKVMYNVADNWSDIFEAYNY